MTIIKTLLIIGGIILVWIITGKIFMLNIEQLEYEVVEKNNVYEIRTYSPYLVAQAPVSDNFEQGMNGGFRVLADYIFGNNTKNGDSEPIAMTSPVIDSQNIAMTSPVIDSKEENRILKFVLPKEYTLESLPNPNNKSVQIIENPGGTYAAIRYTGFRTENSAKKYKKRLLNELEKDEIAYDEKSLSYFYYDPPMTFPWTRRNEVLVRILE